MLGADTSIPIEYLISTLYFTVFFSPLFPLVSVIEILCQYSVNTLSLPHTYKAAPDHTPYSILHTPY